MKIHSPSLRPQQGFTFIEALVTISILSVMAALLVSAFSNAAADTNRIVARQQQVAVQQAVSSWVSGESNRTVTLASGNGIIKTLEQIRTEYNQVETSMARFNKIGDPSGGGYLDSVFFDQVVSQTVNSDKLKSNALVSTKQHLELPTWASGEFPQVNLVND